nr:hypothetical protein [Paraburkholderia tropica]
MRQRQEVQAVPRQDRVMRRGAPVARVARRARRLLHDVLAR